MKKARAQAAGQSPDVAQCQALIAAQQEKIALQGRLLEQQATVFKLLLKVMQELLQQEPSLS